MPARTLTVLSLFSGGMGLDLGFERTKRFRLLACAESVPAFCDTIRSNRDAGRIGDKKLKVYQGDIRDLKTDQVMSDLGIKPGELDLLVGGPPCQSYSTTGKRGTVQDPRGTLLWQFLRFVEDLRPKMFLMENVRGLMSAAVHHHTIKDRPDKGGKPYEPDEEPGSYLTFATPTGSTALKSTRSTTVPHSFGSGPSSSATASTGLWSSQLRHTATRLPRNS